MSAATICSECPKSIPPLAGAGRPRETCSAECYAKRKARRLRERRAWLRQCAAAEAANREYLEKEFNPWAATGKWPEEKP